MTTATLSHDALISPTVAAEQAAKAVSDREAWEGDREKTFNYEVAMAIAVAGLPHQVKSYVKGKTRETENHEACRVVSDAYAVWLTRNYLRPKPGTNYRTDYCARRAVRDWYRSKRERMTRKQLREAEKQAGLSLGRNAERLAPRHDSRGGRPVDFDTLVSRDLRDLRAGLLDLPDSVPEQTARIARLLFKSTKPSDIAAMLGVSRQAVHKSIASLSRWLKEGEDNSDARRVLRLAQIEGERLKAFREASVSGHRSQALEAMLPTYPLADQLLGFHGPYQFAPITITAQLAARIAASCESERLASVAREQATQATADDITKLPTGGRMHFTALGYPLDYPSKFADKSKLSKGTLLLRAKASRRKARDAAKAVKAAKVGATVQQVEQVEQDNDDNSQDMLT